MLKLFCLFLILIISSCSALDKASKELLNLKSNKYDAKETRKRLIEERKLADELKKPVWKPLLEGVDITFDANTKSENYEHLDTAEYYLNTGVSLEKEIWNEYLKPLTTHLNAEQKRDLIIAFSTSILFYDKFERKVLIQKDYSIDDLSKSSLSFNGYLKDGKITGFMKLTNVHGEPDYFTEEVKVVTDDSEWEMVKTEFDREENRHSTLYHLDYKKYPITDPKVFALLNSISTSKHTYIRFKSRKSIGGRQLLKYTQTSSENYRTTEIELNKNDKRQIQSFMNLSSLLKK